MSQILLPFWDLARVLDGVGVNLIEISGLLNANDFLALHEVIIVSQPPSLPLDCVHVSLSQYINICGYGLRGVVNVSIYKHVICTQFQCHYPCSLSLSLFPANPLQINTTVTNSD